MKRERLGRFAIERLLGSGGMGSVYAGHDTETGRPVALKVLAEGLVDDPDKLRRFEQEVSALGLLDHPNIVHLVGPIERDGNEVFFPMERLSGETLSARLRREGPLPVPVALGVFRPLLAALSAAHAAGVVHRDIKPGNILLVEDERVVVSDFGLARLEDITRLTRTGQLMGTLDYMSPEQCEGVEVDHRTDLYSAGIVLYEMLAGEPPFRRATPGAVLHGHLTETAPRIDRVRADLPAGLADVVARLLEKAPAKRYALADLVLADLERVRDPSQSVTFLPGKEPGTGRPPPSPRRSRRRGILLGAAALALLLAAIAGFGLPRQGPGYAGRKTVESTIETIHQAIGEGDFATFAACFTAQALLPFYSSTQAELFRVRSADVADLAFRAEIPMRGATDGAASVRTVSGPALATVLGIDSPAPLRLVLAPGEDGWRVTEVQEAGGPGWRFERERRMLGGRVDQVFRDLRSHGPEILRRLVTEGRIPRESTGDARRRLQALIEGGTPRYEILEEESHVGLGRGTVVVRCPDLARAFGLEDDRFDVELTRTPDSLGWRVRGTRPHAR